MGLPVMLVALFAAADSRPMSEAVEHGELFLSAANGVVAGVVVFLSSRGSGVGGVVAAGILLVMAAPSYAVWALFTTRSLALESYDKGFAVNGGWAFAGVGAIVSLGLCVLARVDSVEVD